MMRLICWAMCSLFLLLCCGLIDAGARERVAVAVVVSDLLQVNTPALPDDLRNDRESPFSPDTAGCPCGCGKAGCTCSAGRSVKVNGPGDAASSDSLSAASMVARGPQVAASPVPLVMYAPHWCGYCKLNIAEFVAAGVPNGTADCPIRIVYSEAPFAVRGYPAFFDPDRNQYLVGRQSMETLRLWVGGRPKK